MALARRGGPAWHPLTIVSLTLTSVSGLQAIAFWTIRADVSFSWWLPNLFLLLYPPPPVAALLRGGAPERETAPGGTAGRREGRRLLGLLLPATFFEGYDEAVLSLVLPDIQKDFGTGEAALGIAQGVIYTTYENAA